MDITHLSSPLSIPHLAMIPAVSGGNPHYRRLFGPAPLFLLSAYYAQDEGCTPVVCTDDREIISICLDQNISFFQTKIPDTKSCAQELLNHVECLTLSVLKPSSPFRKKGLLRKMRTLVTKGKADSCLTVRKIKNQEDTGHLFRKDNSGGEVESFLYYFDDNITLTASSFFKKEERLLDGNSIAFANSFPYCLHIKSETEFKVLRHLLAMDESVCWVPAHFLTNTFYPFHEK